MFGLVLSVVVFICIASCNGLFVAPQESVLGVLLSGRINWG